MHRAFCIFFIIAVSPTAWTKTQWSKEIPDPESGSPLTRERRQFGPGDWIPLTQPCVTCRPLADNGDAGRRNEDIGLTPPKPPTVTRQIHKSTFFPQDESSILSVPPPPVFNRNQIGSANIQGTRFPNFLQQFNSANSLQFDAQSVFPQAQFLSQPFLGSTSLLGSNYPQVLPLLNNPALLVHGNINPTQGIKTPKTNQEAKVPNLQENVIIEQNRQQQQQQQQQQHHVKNQQVPSPVPGLQLPLPNPPVEFAPNRQQQSILEGNILTPPPVPNNTFPDVIIPGLDKEEIQLLYVPLETLKQRTHHHPNQHHQQQQHQIHHQQTQKQQQTLHIQQQQAAHNQQQQHHVHIQQQPAAHNQQQQNQIHHQQQHHVVQHQQQILQNQQHQLIQPQGVQHQQHGFQQQQIVQAQHQQRQQPQQQQQAQQIHQQQRITPSPQTLKFTQQQQSVRTAEHPTTPQPAGHFITHSATPAPHTVDTTFQTLPITPSTLFFQHQPFQSSKAPESTPTPQTPTFQTFLTPSPLTQKFSTFTSITPSENLVTAPEKFQFSQEFVTTPNTIVDQVPVKDVFGKDFFLDGVSHPNKFKSFSIQQQEEQQKQFLLQQQKEEEHQQQLLRQEQEKKLLLEQQERERIHQEKLIREQQERERQIKVQQEEERKQKLIKEQQERERQQKIILEQQERERQQKIIREQQERERQQKIIREQQERERQQKIAREQQERERQQKIAREQQERERQQKIAREQQERERQQKIYREQQERERQQKLLREQQEREHQQKLYREQVERERQQKILKEQQERERQHKLLLEQQERERQQKILLEQQEREHQQKLLLEQQERERQENILREQQERERQQQQLLFEQRERERQEKILLEERKQKELLIKQQQEREQQLLLLQEQEERERQLLLNQQQQQYLVQQQQLTQPLPTQFSLQAQEEFAVTPQFEAQTEIPDDSLVPHQPPLSVFYGGGKGQPRIGDVLKELKGAKTISVLDQYLENIPKVFVGPANLRPPKGYGKFELPYLSNIDVNRVERKVERLPFFVAPLNFIPPAGYAKIPFPAPHVGSVVVSTDTALRQPEKGSTPTYPSTIRSTLHPRLRTTTQSTPTTHIQQIAPKQKFRETHLENPLLPNPEQINELRTEAIITTTIIPETTTQSRGRRPYYRTKARRPTTVSTLQTTRSPESVDNGQFQKTETFERKPSLKFPKQRRQRVKTTTENPEFDSVNSANRQYLVETSPSPATQQHFEGNFNNGFVQQEHGRREVQGIFEVDTRHESKVEQPSTETVANTDFHVPTQSPLTTLGLEVIENTGFTATTQKPPQTTPQSFEPTQKTANTIDYSRFGQTDYFFTTQRVPAAVEIENAGITGFFDQTPRIPVGIESNGDSGFYNKHSFSSTGGENSFFATGQNVEKDTLSSFGKFENTYFQEEAKVSPDSSERDGFFQQQHSAGEIEKEKVSSFKESSVVTQKPEQENVRSTQKSVSFETYYPNTEATTESLKQSSPFPSQSVNQNVEQDVSVHYVEVQKVEEEANPTLPPTTTTTTTEAPGAARVKSRFRTKSRGQVNFANSQTSTQSPYVRKRVVYKTRVHSRDEAQVNGTEEVRTVPKYRGQRKGYQTSTESAVEYDGSKIAYTAKPQRRTSSGSVVRRRKPVTERPNYPPNFNFEYSPSGVSNDVYDDQIRESSLSRNQYAENAVTYTATTSTTTTPVPVTAEVFTRRRDDFAAQKTEEIPTENYPNHFPSEVYVTDISRVTPSIRQTTVSTWERNEEDDLKKLQEAKKAFDPSLEKKNARRRIRVRVHKRPHEQIETAESQNFGTVANALVPPTPAKPSAEPDLYRFSKTGFNFDQSEKFAGTKNQAYVRNITSDILENTATFSAPGVETDTDVRKVTIVTEEKPPATTTELVPETTERSDVEEDKIEKDESREDSREEVIAETTTESIPIETTTYLSTLEDTETDTQEPATTTSTTTTTTTTTTTPSPTTTEQDDSREIQLSTATEISQETEICFRGKCIKTNSATADDDLRKLVQSADKVLIT